MPRLLLVEDEDILRETYELLLSTQPYDVDIAENGQVALEMCEKYTYDLILLDLMMPVIDGVGFLKRFMVEAHEPTRIVILSNLSSGNELDTALKLGAQRSILKASLSPKEFLAAVKYEIDAV